MKNTIFILLILLLLFLWILLASKSKECNAWKHEAEKYEELYLNCKINHDLHMEQHDGEFNLM